MNQSVLIVITVLSFIANLPAQQCAVCELAITTRAYLLLDQITDEQKRVCDKCLVLTTRCYLCGMPVKDHFTRLNDGRVLCARDAKGLVLADDPANQVCDETRTELARSLSRFLTFPESNVTISVVDRIHMEQLFQTPGFDRQCPSIFGYIKSRRDEEGQSKHAISLLNGLPKGRLMATCAHELAHSWVYQHLPRDRQISRDAVEGFCELVAFKLMSDLGQEQEMKVIKSNLYTRGQIGLFLAADSQYGFYTITEWMKSGLDRSLSESDLDRVRAVKFRPSRTTLTEVAPLPRPAPTPVPDTLTLIGISGAGSRRLALIDDLAFSTGESGKVRVGKTNVVVHCLEIRNSSVLIEVEGSPEKQEFFLKSK